MSDKPQVLDPVAQPPSSDEPALVTMRSPVHHLHAGLGAQFTQRAQWLVPAAYGAAGGERERQAMAGLAVADVTARGKVDVRGDIDPVLATLPMRDALVARLSSQWALILTGPGKAQPWLVAGEAAAGRAAMVTDATSVYAGFALLGARVDDLLARLTAVDVSQIGKGAAAGLQLAKVPAILVRGPGATELYVGSEFGRYAWEALLGAGRPLGIQPVGWEALAGVGWA